MKKNSVVHLLGAAVVYMLAAILGSSSGLIHPACFAYSGTFLPLLWGSVYLYTAAYLQSFGAAVLLNGAVLLAALLLGEVDMPLITGLILFTAAAEIIRRKYGYAAIKGVRMSFLPLAYSFYAYTAHWWTDTAGTLEAAREEMRPGYAEMILPVVENKTMLGIMLVLVIPAAVLGMWIAEKILKKQAAMLK